MYYQRLCIKPSFSHLWGGSGVEVVGGVLVDKWETLQVTMWPVLENERRQNKFNGKGTNITTDIATTRLNQTRANSVKNQHTKQVYNRPGVAGAVL